MIDDGSLLAALDDPDRPGRDVVVLARRPG